MGCQISAGSESINTSGLSWLVVRMCDQWYDQERDTDSDGRYQEQVDKTSVKQADKYWPTDHGELVEKFKEQYPDELPFFLQDLYDAREFIAKAAQGDHYISMSH